MPEGELIPQLKNRADNGQFQKGSVPNPGGRGKGVPNKLTTTVKDAIAQAFHEVDGVEYLKRVAQEDPKTFCALLGKLLPMQVANAEDDEELVIKIQYESRMIDGGNG